MDGDALNKLLDKVEKGAFSVTAKTDSIALKSPLRRLPHTTTKKANKTRRVMFSVVRRYVTFVNKLI